MTRTILSWNSANWWLTRFIVFPPWFRLSSFDSYPEHVPIFYRPSSVQEKCQTKVVSWWHGQCCPETRPTDGSWILFWIHHGLAWARSTLVLNKCQYFTESRQLQKNIKPKLLSDDTNNLVLRFRQLMTFTTKVSDGCPRSAYDWHSCMGSMVMRNPVRDGVIRTITLLQRSNISSRCRQPASGEVHVFFALHYSMHTILFHQRKLGNFIYTILSGYYHLRETSF